VLPGYEARRNNPGSSCRAVQDGSGAKASWQRACSGERQANGRQEALKRSPVMVLTAQAYLQ